MSRINMILAIAISVLLVAGPATAQAQSGHSVRMSRQQARAAFAARKKHVLKTLMQLQKNMEHRIADMQARENTVKRQYACIEKADNISVVEKCMEVKPADPHK